MSDYEGEFSRLLGHAVWQAEPSLGYALQVPESWQQGRTLYGGFSAALVAVAAAKLVPAQRPLRSAMVGFLGPSQGEVQVAAEVIRTGRTATSVESRLNWQGQPAVRALFVFGEGHDSVLNQPGPVLPDGVALPADISTLETKIMEVPAGAPQFMAHYDYVPVLGAPAFSGSTEPVLGAWVRLRDRQMWGEPLESLLVGDALYPSNTMRLPAPAPVSSMTWSLDVLVDQPKTEQGWWLVCSQTLQAARGFSTEDITVWNTHGMCVSLARQMVVSFA